MSFGYLLIIINIIKKVLLVAISMALVSQNHLLLYFHNLSNYLCKAAGGGIIRIRANDMIVDGTIDASANDDCSSDCGGGAGIIINCYSLLLTIITIFAIIIYFYLLSLIVVCYLLLMIFKGGGIYLEVQTLSGEGSIIANGGVGPVSTDNGGGGGGLISVLYSSSISSFHGPFSAHGGAAGNPGGAGIVYLRDSNAASGYFITFL